MTGARGMKQRGSARLSLTMTRYISRQFLFSFLTVFLLFIGIILLIDLIELLRRASGKEDASFGIVVSMAVYKLPLTAQKTLPFAVLFGGMLAFWRLNRSSELIALRAAGVSVWQFIFPIILVALIAGVVKVAAINPLSTIMIAQFEQLENKYIRGRSNLMATTDSGVWLRQVDESGHSVIYGRGSKIENGQLTLTKVIVLLYKGADTYSGRIDAPAAVLKKGYWEFSEPRITLPDKPTRKDDVFRLKTNLTIDSIQDSFSSPSTVSFWDLPRFIKSLEATGFSALSHRLHWHSLIAEPILYCAMILIAAVFSLRHNRRAGVLLAVAGGIAAGFVLFFVSDLVLALAYSTGLPPLLAAWAPTVAGALLGTAVLLHVEDG